MLSQIKRVQSDYFDPSSKIGFISGQKLVLLNLDGSTFSQFELDTPVIFTFPLDYQHVIIVPSMGIKFRSRRKREQQSYFQILDITTGDYRIITTTITSPIIKGIVLENLKNYFLLAFYHENNIITILRVSKDSDKVKELSYFDSHSTSQKINLYYHQGILYSVGYELEVFDIRNPAKPVLKPIEEVFPSLINALLGNGILITIDDITFVFWNEGKKIGTLVFNKSLTTLQYNQISKLNGIPDQFLFLKSVKAGVNNYQMVLERWKFLEEGQTLILLESYNVGNQFTQFISLDKQNVLLIPRYSLTQENYPIKLNLVTKKVLKYPILSHLSFETRFLLESGDKIKILRCLLRIKLRKQLPKDLILETFSFF